MDTTALSVTGREVGAEPGRRQVLPKEGPSQL